MAVGRRLGKHEIRGLVGSGTSAVCEGRAPDIARRVAIKVVRLPEPGDTEAEVTLERVRREPQAVGHHGAGRGA